VLLLDNVRIHLDEVDGLGRFLELEAVVDAAHDEAACRRRVVEITAAPRTLSCSARADNTTRAAGRRREPGEDESQEKRAEETLHVGVHRASSLLRERPPSRLGQFVAPPYIQRRTAAVYRRYSSPNFCAMYRSSLAITP